MQAQFSSRADYDAHCQSVRERRFHVIGQQPIASPRGGAGFRDNAAPRSFVDDAACAAAAGAEWAGLSDAERRQFQDVPEYFIAHRVAEAHGRCRELAPLR